MNEKDYIKEFFSNPYSLKYLQYFNDLLRMAVSGITASCGYAELNAAERNGLMDTETFGEVWEQCLGLMRASELTTALIGGFDEQRVINAEELLREICTGCNELIGDKYNMTVSGERDGFIRGDARTLKYIILSVIRSIVLDNGADLMDIELSVAKKDENVRILLRCDRDVDISKGAILSDDSCALNEMLAERLGGKFIRKPDGCELVLPAAVPDGRLNSDPPVRFGDNGRYSTFNIMLKGILPENSGVSHDKP